MAEFKGQHFEPPDHINQRRVNRLGVLARQAKAAEKSGNEEAAAELMMDYMAAVEDLVTMCLRQEDVERFDALCDDQGVSDEELQRFVGEQVRDVAGRPTSPSSDSSDGQTSTPPKSEGGSYLRVVQRLEDEGRPDVALMVLMANGDEGQISSIA